MYGLAVNLIVSVSGHPWIINEITDLDLNFGCLGLIYSSAIVPLLIVGKLSLQDHTTSSLALIL